MNIYLRKDGRYESRVPNGKRGDGKRAFLYVLARTKEQCIERVQAICHQRKPQGYCNLTVTDLFLEWHCSILHRVKESTAANYNMKAQKHILPAFGDTIVSKVTTNHIYRFISEKQKAGFSHRYIADIVVLLKTLFKYAVRTYQISNPMDGVIMPKRKTPEIQLLDEDEQKTLQKYIGQHQNRSTLGIAIALTGGMRIGEICPLQWRDVDLEKRIFTVTKTMQRIQCADGEKKTKLIITDPKTESSRRQIPIPDCMMSFLLKFKGKPNEYVLTGTDSARFCCIDDDSAIDR